MAGGKGKYRHLGRKSSHRQALLRNLVTSLFENESITTTWAKAKEAQRLADKLITLGKKNSEASRRRALEIFYVRDHSAGTLDFHGIKGFKSAIWSGLDFPWSFESQYTPGANNISLETPRHPPQALRSPPRTLRRTTRWLHPRAPR